MIEIKTKSDGNVFIVELHGKLDAVAAKESEGSVLDAVSANEKVIVDMAKCSYVSSAGLRFLLLIAKKARQEGCKAVLSDVQPDVWDVITMTGFESVLEAFPSRMDALKALK